MLPRVKSPVHRNHRAAESVDREPPAFVDSPDRTVEMSPSLRRILRARKQAAFLELDFDHVSQARLGISSSTGAVFTSKTRRLGESE